MAKVRLNAKNIITYIIVFALLIGILAICNNVLGSDRKSIISEDERLDGSQEPSSIFPRLKENIVHAINYDNVTLHASDLYATYAYKGISLLPGSVIKKISIPIVGVESKDIDSFLTLSVCDISFNRGIYEISSVDTYKLILPKGIIENEYKGSIESFIDVEYDDIKWVTFNVNIPVDSGQTISLGSAGDTVRFVVGNNPNFAYGGIRPQNVCFKLDEAPLSSAPYELYCDILVVR